MPKVSGDIFVGREDQLEKFRSLIHEPYLKQEGVVWLIQGAPGIGKSRLLEMCRNICLTKHHPSINCDMRDVKNDTAAQEGHAWLKQLCQASEELAAPYCVAAGNPLGAHREIARHEGAIGKLVDAFFSVALDQNFLQKGTLINLAAVFIGLLCSKHKASLDELKLKYQNQPELLLIQLLKKEGTRRPVLFLDTFEHALSEELHIKSRLDLNSNMREQNGGSSDHALANFLSVFVTALQESGWIVVAAGRDFGKKLSGDFTQLAGLSVEDITRLLEELLGQLGGTPHTNYAALAARIHTLSFNGNSLWVRSITRLIMDSFKEGDTTDILIGKGELENRFGITPLEENPDEAKTKIEIIRCIFKGTNLNLETIWMIALPWRITKEVLEALFPDQNPSALSTRIREAGFFSMYDQAVALLHEEVRDLLFWWAEKKLRSSKDVRNAHRLLLGMFRVTENKQKKSDQFGGNVQTDWMLEGAYHAVFGSENLIINGYDPHAYYKALVGSPSFSIHEKWTMATSLENIEPFLLGGLFEILGNEHEEWSKLFGTIVVDDLRDAISAGKAKGIKDLEWWKKRTICNSDAGYFHGWAKVARESFANTTKDVNDMKFELLSRHGQSLSLKTNIQVAGALIGMAAIFNQLGDQTEAFKAYEYIISHFGERPEPELAEKVATALGSKGVTLGQLNRSDEAIAVYDEVARRFGEHPEPELVEQVAKALFNKGVTLGQLNRSDEAIKVYDEVARRFGDRPEPELVKQVAKALVNKGVTLGQLNRSDEAMGAEGDVPEFREFLQRSVGGGEKIPWKSEITAVDFM